MRETGSDKLMELASDLSTHFGHEGPTHDIPGTLYITTSHLCDMREVLYARGHKCCMRAERSRNGHNKSGSTIDNEAAELLNGSTTIDHRQSKVE